VAVAHPKAESPMEPAVEKAVGEMEPTKGGKEREVSPLENYLSMNGFDLNSEPSPILSCVSARAMCCKLLPPLERSFPLP